MAHPLLLLLAATAVNSAAHATPPSAQALGVQAPEAAAEICSAAPPSRGATFAGPVLHVIDGRTLCVALGPRPDEWVRLRLSEVAPSTRRSTLMAAIFAKRVVCVADGDDRDGAVGRCALDDVPLDVLTGSPAVRADAAFWR